MSYANALLMACAVLVSGCAQQSVKQRDEYNLQVMQYLYAQEKWRFEGRLAIDSQEESFSGTINWQHQPFKDVIKLAGPMGQGRLSVIITSGAVVVDDGDKQRVYLQSPEKVFAKYVAVVVPVCALRYWVLGLVEPGRSYTEFDKGFVQRDWRVDYRQMQIEEGMLLPRKINFKNKQTKIKLIIDQWTVL